mmetsp:Transcript_176634/g.566383  ORF Transcript_176634/g.566383 Transcript_176634/m.566383 type:complete len:206 (-) Transcript_176634:168-785(-)
MDGQCPVATLGAGTLHLEHGDGGLHAGVRRIVQRSVPLCIFDFQNLLVAVHKPGNGVVKAGVRRQVQRGLLLGVPGVDVGAPRNQQLAHVPCGREKERRLPMSVGDVGVRDGVQKHFYTLGFAVENSHVQWPNPAVVPQVGVSAHLEQQLQQPNVMRLNCAPQRRQRSLPSVRVRTLLQSLFHCIQVRLPSKQGLDGGEEIRWHA